MAARTLVIGSGNPDKSREVRNLLAGSPWDVIGLSDLESIPEPEEDQPTFEGNALLKAAYYANHFDLPCVADDSGIAVEALDDRPGVYSARYAGENCTYADNNLKLLQELEGVPDSRRGAHFVCCAAYADPSGARHVVRGEVYGRIAESCRGRNGFGYDPLFILEGYDQTFGELDPSVKHAVSHRGRAFAQMAEYLLDIVSGSCKGG